MGIAAPRCNRLSADRTGGAPVPHLCLSNDMSCIHRSGARQEKFDERSSTREAPREPHGENVMVWSVSIGSIAGTAVRIHITFVLFLAWIFIASWVSGGADAAWNSLAFL